MSSSPVVETPRLVLRPIAEDDLDFLLSLWNDPVIMRFAGGIRNWSRPDILEWFGKYARRHPSFPDDLFPEEVHFLVRLRDGQRIGESGLGMQRFQGLSGKKRRHVRCEAGQAILGPWLRDRGHGRGGRVLQEKDIP